ncbi:hypothetical protein [Nonomuraea sp. NPDC001023]|uniref:hypothetical protein n=1 Tax=unclassified Nonomuraea TaxID=2593643 RepID=UPI003327FB66
MLTACSSPPPTSTVTVEVRAIAFGASRPPATAPSPSTPNDSPAARAVKPRVFCR